MIAINAPMQTARLPLLILLGSGCAPALPVPMTAGQLAGYSSGEAVVAYLGQADASASVCDLDAEGPHLARVDEDVREALVGALGEGRIPPVVWRDCLERLVRSAGHQRATALLDEVAESYLRLLTDPHVEHPGASRRRLLAAHLLLLERPETAAPHAPVIAELRRDLRRVLSRRVGLVTRRHAEEVLAMLDLEQGVLRGRTVDLAMLDQLRKAGDEAQLRRAAVRLPDAGLRAQARRRLLRLRIQASPYREVSDRPGAVEELMMSAGANIVTIADHRPLRGWIEATALPARVAWVRQDLLRQSATLLGQAPGQARLSVLPGVPLRDLFRVELEGLSRSVTVCAPPRELDPTPCLQARDIALSSPFVWLDRDGILHPREELSGRDAVALARAERLVVPIEVAGRPLATLIWDVRFERHDDLVLDAPTNPRGAFHLRVRLEQSGERLIYDVATVDRRYLAVVEAADVRPFHVISRGRAGLSGGDGSSGSDGSRGATGSDASCPSWDASNGDRGGDGSRGSPGSDGGPGGDGGNILVVVSCAGGSCDDLPAVARRTIVSQGGPGGRGGRGGGGGQGGPGGWGGRSTSCTDAHGHVRHLSSGSTGSRGRDGSSGSDGFTGPNGSSGRVEVVIDGPSR
jgi:hypothetical protein